MKFCIFHHRHPSGLSNDVNILIRLSFNLRLNKEVVRY